MTTPPVQTLLGVVRRRLRRDRLLVAVRRAAWASAAALLMVVALHVLGWPVGTDAALLVACAPWVALVAWSAWYKPTAAECALWADRRLDGQSAYTTLLDVGQRRSGIANAQAVQCLERWAASRVPGSLRLLPSLPGPTGRARALGVWLVCAALAGVVLTLGTPAPAPELRSRASAPAASGAAAALTPGAGTPALAGPEKLAREVASALQPGAAPHAPERPGAGGGSAAGAGSSDRPESRGPAPARPDLAPGGADPQGAPRAPASATPTDAPPAAGRFAAAGAGSGREAGESRDERVDVGVSQALRDTIAVPRFEPTAGRTSSARQADQGQAATYEDGAARPSGVVEASGTLSAPAAAPPAATDSARLSATENNYVQAWMKANARSR
jgi:hypothetical protein